MLEVKKKNGRGGGGGETQPLFPSSVQVLLNHKTKNGHSSEGRKIGTMSRQTEMAGQSWLSHSELDPQLSVK